ncbi:MAG: Ig-like domain-containing protein, partial [Paludibacteraceae bacterium]|nr:Ig-like domain-containing protein [Paludibacteraceae bacterium]
MAALAMFSCKKQETSAYSSDPTYMALTVGEQGKVNVMCYGVKSSEGTEVSGVTWSCSNKYVADVDANGVVTAKKVGTAEVTGSFQNGKLVTCTVAVLGTSYLFVEPYIGVSMSEAMTSEEQDQDSIVRKGENYFVSFDKSGNSKYSDYKFYSYG